MEYFQPEKGMATGATDISKRGFGLPHQINHYDQ